MSSPSQCEACNAPLRDGLATWHRACPDCGLESSTLKPRIGGDGAPDKIDELEREKALQPIRDRNFDILLEWIPRRFRDSGNAARPTLLEVGCAHGWFASKARKDFDVLGIEPDLRIAAKASSRGVKVRTGYFPHVLAEQEMFDVIVFNDVLEHIPGVVDAMRACHAHLAGGGLLIVNAPDRRGIFYRLSKLFWRMGQPGPFERMWQVGMPSPHLYYFGDAAMAKLANEAELQIRAKRRLPSLSIKGMYSRIRFDRSVSAPRAIILYSGLLVLVPLLRLLPSDISVWFLEPKRLEGGP